MHRDTGNRKTDQGERVRYHASNRRGEHKGEQRLDIADPLSWRPSTGPPKQFKGQEHATYGKGSKRIEGKRLHASRCKRCDGGGSSEQYGENVRKPAFASIDCPCKQQERIQHRKGSRSVDHLSTTRHPIFKRPANSPITADWPHRVNTPANRFRKRKSPSMFI